MLPEGAAHLHALRCPPTSPGLTSLHMLMPRRRCGRSVAATTGVVRIGHGHEWNFPAGRGRRSAARRDRKRVRLYALRSPDCGFRRERQRSESRQKEAQVVRFVGEGHAADVVRVLAHADNGLGGDLHVRSRIHTRRGIVRRTNSSRGWRFSPLTGSRPAETTPRWREGFAPVVELGWPRSEVRAHRSGKIPHRRFDCRFGHASVTDHESTVVRRHDSKRREGSDPDAGTSGVFSDRAVINPRGAVTCGLIDL